MSFGPCATHRDDVGSLALELLRRVLGDISGHAADLPAVLELGVVQEGVDDGAALVAGGPKDGDDLLLSHGWW